MASSVQKIRSLEETRHLRQQLKNEGKQVVFTNGCFDILHPGHTRYLSSARDLGDFLLVAVNSDRSVAHIKGPKRPIVAEQTRAEVLAALACVDGVLIFDQPDPLRIIQSLVPDVLVKGGDWAEEEIIGADVVQKNGGKVIRIPFVEGFSTTQLIQTIVKRYG
ncbi:MAG: D-glycero-beta-D-manno-heptose 1-phosphate adenylyltransferase [Deltaproteobacteria bacterium]|nr:D-glycero-beta-D-manno-heptose 1-phosphate adenylyltransferase [Deltaproteobacteria bacterium]